MSLPEGPWNERWTFERLLSRHGGQGETYVVNDCVESSTFGVLKVLKEQKDSERRSRLFREAKTLESLSGADGIAELLDSNVDKYKEDDLLYIVTEYIEGTHPDNKMECDAALDFTLALMEILVYCHEQLIVHRDIKPNNIVLHGGNPVEPYLIDFGLTFNHNAIDDLSTAAAQGIGPRNWFFLPEMAAGAEAQRFAVMDLTHTLGVLFNVVTGLRPLLLRDEAGLKPHERPSAVLELQKLGIDLHSRLKFLFDIGFNYEIAERWKSADQVIEVVNSIRNRQNTKYQSQARLNDAIQKYKKSDGYIRAGALSHFYNVFVTTLERFSYGRIAISAMPDESTCIL